MSEYQYYEFLAIDRLLRQSEMDALRACPRVPRSPPAALPTCITGAALGISSQDDGGIL